VSGGQQGDRERLLSPTLEEAQLISTLYKTFASEYNGNAESDMLFRASVLGTKMDTIKSKVQVFLSKILQATTDLQELGDCLKQKRGFYQLLQLFNLQGEREDLAAADPDMAHPEF
jgi:hypothetical protein